MMEVGIFARTYRRPTLEATLDAVAAHGFRHVQFNMASAGLAPLPDAIPAGLVTRIREAMDARNLTMTALSGTFNMAHPDRDTRMKWIDRFEILASAADDLGARLVTLCSGTRDPDNMWRRHPENTSFAAWQDSLECLMHVTIMSSERNFMLGIEPEPGNVVSDAQKARQMLHEVGSDNLGIIFDPANVIDGVPEDHVEATIGSALAEVGHQIISVHGKDRDAAGNVVPAGEGIVPWESFIAGLRRVGYGGTILLHGLDEADVPLAKKYLEWVIEYT
jgi:sugar phosphate isomerase/epimerase